MPDVIIKGMEKMPIACCECPCVYGNICAAENKRPTFEEWSKCKPDWCPLRPAPDPSTYGGMLRQLNDEDLAVWLSEMTKSAALCGLPVSKRHALDWLRRPWEGGDGDG